MADRNQKLQHRESEDRYCRAAGRRFGTVAATTVLLVVTWIAVAWLTIAWLTLAMATGTAAAVDEPVDAGATSGTADQDSLLIRRGNGARDIQRLWRAAQVDSALTAIADYLDAFPTDGAMHYNHACLLEAGGETEAAWQSYARAVALGWDDFVAAAADPDLGALITDPRFGELRARREAELATLARERAVTLEAGTWSEPIPLGAAAAAGTEGTVAGDVRLRFNQRTLEIEATIVDPDFRAGPPWRGASGLFVVLGTPPADDAVALGRPRTFALGRRDPAGVGAVLLERPVGRWQRVAELAPKIRFADEGRIVVEARVPWTAVRPLHPLTDPLLGLNIVYQGSDPSGGLRTLALLPDPSYAAAVTDRRRGVVLALNQGAGSEAGLAGSVNNTVVGKEPLEIELTAWIPAGGTGTLTVSFGDRRGQSVVASGDQIVPVTLEPGLQVWRRRADLSALPTGSYLAVARLDLPDGTEVRWRAALLRLDASWSERAGEQVGGLPELERPTVRYRLDAIEAALDQLGPHDDPGAVATTVVETEGMLMDAARDGSIVPESGLLVAVYSGPNGRERLCALHFPPGHQELRGEDRRAALILAEMPGAAESMATETALQLPDDTPALLMVPHFEVAGGDGEDPVAVARACLEWGRAFLDFETVRLAGIDAGGGTALKLSLADPAALTDVLIMAGHGFSPWPQDFADGPTADALAARLARRLADSPNELPYHWILFPSETRRSGQAEAVLASMQDAGFLIAGAESVRGGFSRSQATGRIALWLAQPHALAGGETESEGTMAGDE